MNNMTRKQAEPEASHMSKKECTKCGEVKPFGDYGNHRNGKHGLQPACKACTAKSMAAYRAANREAIIQSKRKWNGANREVLAERSKEYRRKNKDLIKKRAREYEEANKEAIAEYKREYYQKNKQAFTRRRRKWYKENRELTTKRNKEKYKKDPLFKIARLLRGRLGQAMVGNLKAAPTRELLGCTYKHARQHIESQFTDGMSWDNHGMHGWHIDHVIPCASFDLTDPEQQKECFHYTNLQPLWAEDNLKKSDKLPHQLSYNQKVSRDSPHHEQAGQL